MERSEAPSYRLASVLFLRLLGVCFLFAFLSLWVQIDGLIGSSGILPVSRFLEQARQVLGAGRLHELPTLCWLDSSDAMLHALCAGGVLVSVLAFVGVARPVCLGLAWVFSLSLSVAGQVFFEFQWDLLLLEAGVLGFLLAGPALSPRAARAAPVSALALLLVRVLLFRLNFSSGVVKLASGDPAWRTLAAMRYHYETQPLPTWIGWFAHQLPGGLQSASTVGVFAVELVVPFFVFGPPRVRRAAGGILALFQIAVAATGNYAFFNILAAALCVVCFDDAAFPRRWRERQPNPEGKPWPRWVLFPAAGVLLFSAAVQTAALFRGAVPIPGAAVSVARWLAPFRSTNGYGLFAVMTVERPEIVLEGSADGLEWKPYEFRWKPGDVRRRPGFVAPHQPRLDWQMWFAALSGFADSPWLEPLLARLLEGSPPVLALLRTNPFPDRPPRFVRAVLYDYRFTDFATRRATGAWWRRVERGPFTPIFSKDRLESP